MNFRWSKIVLQTFISFFIIVLNRAETKPWKFIEKGIKELKVFILSYYLRHSIHKSSHPQAQCALVASFSVKERLVFQTINVVLILAL